MPAAKTNLISYKKMVTSKRYSGFEVQANHAFIIKCGTYGYNGKMDGYFILSEFVRENLILFNLDSLEYEFIDPRFDSKEYFEGAYRQSKEYFENASRQSTGLNNEKA